MNLAYISSYKDSRKKLQRIDREKIVEALVKNYLKDLKKYLGLDLGTKTLGVAISDSTLLIASFYKNLLLWQYRWSVKRSLKYYWKREHF